MGIKNKTLDIVASSEDAEWNIEVNTSNKNYLRKRNASYIFKMYANSIDSGSSYNNMKNFIQINISDKLSKQIPSIVSYTLSNTKYELKYIDNIIIYEINLEKIYKEWYNTDKYIVLRMLNMSKEELLQTKGDEIVDRIKNKAIDLNKKPKLIRLMSDEKEGEMILNTERENAYLEGTIQGKIQGIKNTNINNAKEMIKEGISLNTISKITHLSEEEIRKLARELEI